MRRWHYKCPCCNKRVVVNSPRVEIKKKWTGATTNCGSCGSMLLIKKNLEVIDFCEYLNQAYAEARSKIAS